MQPILEIRNATKEYRGVPAVRDWPTSAGISRAVKSRGMAGREPREFRAARSKKVCTFRIMNSGSPRIAESVK